MREVERNPADVPPALAPPPGHPRFPYVDGARAIAALSIVGLHVAGTFGFRDEHPLGWTTVRLGVGVTIFFVISGFLLYRPFVAGRLGQAPTPHLASFWQRRALRIVPAYWAALLAVTLTVVAGVADDDHDLTSSRWPMYWGFLQVYSVRSLEGGLPHAWTLCVEVTFYLLLPGLAVLAGRLASRRAELAMIAGLAVASVAARWILVEPGELQWEQATLPTLFAWFAAGMALAVMSASGAVARPIAFLGRRPLWSWLLAAAVYAGFTAPPAPDFDSLIVVDFLVNLAVAVLVFIPAAFGDDPRSLPRRFLRWRPVAWLGLVSYGIYLWHVPVLWFLLAVDAESRVPQGSMLVLTLALTIPAAAVSYYAVERPFLRRKHRGRLRV